MSNLKQKSEANFEAGELLTGKNNYAPSIHCYYYSCLQLVKSCIREYSYESYKALDDGYQAYKDQQAILEKSYMGSHNYLIFLVQQLIEKAENKQESLDFLRNMRELKAMRVDSDYENVQISVDVCCSARRHAMNIRDQLTTILKI